MSDGSTWGQRSRGWRHSITRDTWPRDTWPRDTWHVTRDMWKDGQPWIGHRNNIRESCWGFCSASPQVGGKNNYLSVIYFCITSLRTWHLKHKGFFIYFYFLMFRLITCYWSCPSELELSFNLVHICVNLVSLKTHKLQLKQIADNFGEFLWTRSSNDNFAIKVFPFPFWFKCEVILKWSSLIHSFPA